jgi:hypothetical protein
VIQGLRYASFYLTEFSQHTHAMIYSTVLGETVAYAHLPMLDYEVLSNAIVESPTTTSFSLTESSVLVPVQAQVVT